MRTIEAPTLELRTAEWRDDECRRCIHERAPATGLVAGARLSYGLARRQLLLEVEIEHLRGGPDRVVLLILGRREPIDIVQCGQELLAVVGLGHVQEAVADHRDEARVEPL